jgi:uncharacterized membrane protein YhaH (DUF805 family)
MQILSSAEPPYIFGCVWTLITAVILALLTQLTGRALPDGLVAGILIVAALIPAAHISWRRRA